jgi:hypothetical protein
VRYISLLLLIMGVHTHIAPTLITDIMAIGITQIMEIMGTDITQIIYQIAH